MSSRLIPSAIWVRSLVPKLKNLALFAISSAAADSRNRVNRALGKKPGKFAFQSRSRSDILRVARALLMNPQPDAATPKTWGNFTVAALSRLSAGDFYLAVIGPRIVCSKQRKSAGASVPLSPTLHEGFPPGVPTLASFRI